MEKSRRPFDRVADGAPFVIAICTIAATGDAALHPSFTGGVIAFALLNATVAAFAGRVARARYQREAEKLAREALRLARMTRHLEQAATVIGARLDGQHRTRKTD